MQQRKDHQTSDFLELISSEKTNIFKVNKYINEIMMVLHCEEVSKNLLHLEWSGKALLRT